jgi:hypothetical protein
VEISNGAVIKCNYELRAKVVNKSNIQSKTLSSYTPYYVTIYYSCTPKNIVVLYCDHLALGCPAWQAGRLTVVPSTDTDTLDWLETTSMASDLG